MIESQGKGVRMADVATKAGISRQALYLHFGTRAELLIATTFCLDELKGSEARRAAANGSEKLDAYIDRGPGQLDFGDLRRGQDLSGHERHGRSCGARLGLTHAGHARRL